MNKTSCFPNQKIQKILITVNKAVNTPSTVTIGTQFIKLASSLAKKSAVLQFPPADPFLD